MESSSFKIQYGSSKLMIILKVLVSLITTCGAIVWLRSTSNFPYEKNYFILSLFGISISAFFISLSRFSAPYITVTMEGITYSVYSTMNGRIYIHDFFKWEEVNHFERYNKFIFIRKIKIVLKEPNHSFGRNCNIGIVSSKIPLNKLCDVLNKHLQDFNENNKN